MSASSDLEPGSVLAGQFRIRAKLAEGGMGAMYLAEQLVVDRLVAIKVVHKALAARDPETHERFKREARALAQIRHPNVVQLYTFGLTDDGSPFFAMEYVAGTTLEATLAHGRLQLPRTLAIAEQIASALAEAHRCGVIHRDLKPANIMLSDGPQRSDIVKVVDFGIAKALGESVRLTRSGTFFGTPLYAAPEQVRAQPVDARTDIYSLGLVLYEMLTGESPFSAVVPFELLAQQVTVEPDPPSRRCPELPLLADAIVLQCLQKRPEHRYATADALGRDLAHLRAAISGDFAPSHDAAHRPQPTAAGGVGVESGPRQPSPLRPYLDVPHEAERDAPRALGPNATQLEGLQRERVREPQPSAHTPWSFVRTGSSDIVAGAPVALRLSTETPLMQDDPESEWRARRRRSKLLRYSLAVVVVAGAVIASGTVLWTKRGETSRSAATQLGNVAQSPAAAVRDVVMLCLNSQAEPIYRMQASYAAWAGMGPTPREAPLRTMSAVREEQRCLDAITRVASQPALDGALKTQAQAFGQALSELASRSREAARYYAAREDERDGMQNGRAMHQPLLAAFAQFGASERALRKTLATRAEAAEPALLRRLSQSSSECELALAELAHDSRGLVGVAKPASGGADRIVHATYAAALAALSRAVDRVDARCQGLDDSAAQSTVTASKKLVTEAKRFGQSLDSFDRAFGPAAQAARLRLMAAVSELLDNLNQTQWMRREARAELTPIDPPDEPKR